MTKVKRVYNTSQKEKLYSRSNHLNLGLVIVIIISGFAGLYTFNKSFFLICGLTLFLSGILAIASHIYFKKADVLRGVSRHSKLQILGTIMWGAGCFYFGYYVLKYFFF